MSNPAPGWEKYPDHVVAVTPFSGTIEIKRGDQLVAQSSEAIEVNENRHGTVWYLPLADVQAELSVSDTQTYCPFKGYASYRNLELNDETVTDALWIYEDPYDECLPLKGYASFYADKVNITQRP